MTGPLLKNYFWVMCLLIFPESVFNYALAIFTAVCFGVEIFCLMNDGSVFLR